MNRMRFHVVSFFKTVWLESISNGQGLRFQWCWFLQASAQLFPDKTLSVFTDFLREQLSLERQGEVAFVKIVIEG